MWVKLKTPRSIPANPPKQSDATLLNLSTGMAICLQEKAIYSLDENGRQPLDIQIAEYDSVVVAQKAFDRLTDLLDARDSVTPDFKRCAC